MSLDDQVKGVNISCITSYASRVNQADYDCKFLKNGFIQQLKKSDTETRR